MFNGHDYLDFFINKHQVEILANQSGKGRWRWVKT